MSRASPLRLVASFDSKEEEIPIHGTTYEKEGADRADHPSY